METISALARRTGTSPRMLRHWEAEGLLEPAAVDARTNERRYAPAQAGRVRAIAALRSVGFGLDAIRTLLDQGLTEPELVDLLRRRERELLDRIEQDTEALADVRSRLASLEHDKLRIVSSLTVTAIPERRVLGVRETVANESEIPDAVERLLVRLAVDRGALARDVELLYDGTTDERVIAVTAGLVDDGSTPVGEGTAFTLPPASVAAVACFDAPPRSTGDAWIALDAELETRDLRAVGPYRQTLHADGGVTIATPVVPAARAEPPAERERVAPLSPAPRRIARPPADERRR